MLRLIHKCELMKSDVLLKSILPDAELISRAIGLGQKLHVKKFLGARSSDYARNIGFDPSKVSHAALALGNNQIMEFDEGSGIDEIMKYKGAGVVYDKPSGPVDRSGNEYIVIRCLHQPLANRVWNKAIAIQCHSAVVHSASYGIRKLISSSLLFSRGSPMTQAKIDKMQHKMSGDVFGAMGMRRNNMFCSEFVATCYLWAAHDLVKTGELANIETIFGTASTRLSPGELGVRMLTTGANFFTQVGIYKG